MTNPFLQTVQEHAMQLSVLLLILSIAAVLWYVLVERFDG